MEVTRVFDILTKLEAEFPNKPNLLVGKEKKQDWKPYSVSDFVSNANYVSAALLQRGIKPGDKIALIANNRPEWNFVDFGCQMAGAITVPIFPTISQHDLQFILTHAEVKGVFISTADIFKKLELFRHDWCFDFVCSFNNVENTIPFNEFTETGKKQGTEKKKKNSTIKQKNKTEDLKIIL